jgi:hypothetical protein
MGASYERYAVHSAAVSIRDSPGQPSAIEISRYKTPGPNCSHSKIAEYSSPVLAAHHSHRDQAGSSPAQETEGITNRTAATLRSDSISGSTEEEYKSNAQGTPCSQSSRFSAKEEIAPLKRRNLSTRGFTEPLHSDGQSGLHLHNRVLLKTMVFVSGC